MKVSNGAGVLTPHILNVTISCHVYSSTCIHIHAIRCFKHKLHTHTHTHTQTKSLKVEIQPFFSLQLSSQVSNLVLSHMCKGLMQVSWFLCQKTNTLEFKTSNLPHYPLAIQYARKLIKETNIKFLVI